MRALVTVGLLALIAVAMCFGSYLALVRRGFADGPLLRARHRGALMICPYCKKDSVQFLSVWLKGLFSKYQCGDCGAISRLQKRAKFLGVVSGCFGAIAAGLGLYFRSWLVFFIALAIVIVLDFFMDFTFYQLEPIEQK